MLATTAMGLALTPWPLLPPFPSLSPLFILPAKGQNLGNIPPNTLVGNPGPSAGPAVPLPAPTLSQIQLAVTRVPYGTLNQHFSAEFPNGVWQDGPAVHTPGTAQASLLYTATGFPCSLNSGAGDGGWQVKSLDNGCWEASFPSEGVKPEYYGWTTAVANAQSILFKIDTAMMAVDWPLSVARRIILPPKLSTFDSGPANPTLQGGVKAIGCVTAGQCEIAGAAGMTHSNNVLTYNPQIHPNADGTYGGLRIDNVKFTGPSYVQVGTFVAPNCGALLLVETKSPTNIQIERVDMHGVSAVGCDNQFTFLQLKDSILEFDQLDDAYHSAWGFTASGVGLDNHPIPNVSNVQVTVQSCRNTGYYCGNWAVGPSDVSNPFVQPSQLTVKMTCVGTGFIFSKGCIDVTSPQQDKMDVDVICYNVSFCAENKHTADRPNSLPNTFKQRRVRVFDGDTVDTGLPSAIIAYENDVTPLSVSSTTHGTNILTVATAGITVGNLITGSDIPINTFVASIDGSHTFLTMSQAATGSSTDTRTFSGVSSGPDFTANVVADITSSWAMPRNWAPGINQFKGDTFTTGGNTYIVIKAGLSDPANPPTGTVLNTGYADGSSIVEFLKATSYISQFKYCVQIEAVSNFEITCHDIGVSGGAALIPQGSSDNTIARGILNIYGWHRTSCVTDSVSTEFGAISGFIDRLTLNGDCHVGGLNGWTPESLHNGDVILPGPTNNIGRWLFQATTGGLSGSTEPTWPTTVGLTVTDGTIVWTNRGQYNPNPPLYLGAVGAGGTFNTITGMRVNGSWDGNTSGIFGALRTKGSPAGVDITFMPSTRLSGYAAALYLAGPDQITMEGGALAIIGGASADGPITGASGSATTAVVTATAPVAVENSNLAHSGTLFNFPGASASIVGPFVVTPAQATLPTSSTHCSLGDMMYSTDGQHLFICQTPSQPTGPAVWAQAY